MASRRVLVKVVSDIICPWCLVGSRRMNIALERAVTEGYLKSKEEVEIKWFPFFLDPTLPIKGRDKLKGYQAKFGAERTAQILPYMTSVGKTVGIDFDWGGKTANTSMGHQLLTWALEKHGSEAQCRLSEILFRVYLERKGNLGDRATLLDAVEEAGLPRKEGEDVLLTGSYEDKVIEEVHSHMRKYRIQGVPYFIVSAEGSDREVCLSGAQEPEEFMKVLRDLLPATVSSKSPAVATKAGEAEAEGEGEGGAASGAGAASGGAKEGKASEDVAADKSGEAKKEEA